MWLSQTLQFETTFFYKFMFMEDTYSVSGTTLEQILFHALKFDWEYLKVPFYVCLKKFQTPKVNQTIRKRLQYEKRFEA